MAGNPGAKDKEFKVPELTHKEQAQEYAVRAEELDLQGRPSLANSLRNLAEIEFDEAYKEIEKQFDPEGRIFGSPEKL